MITGRKRGRPSNPEKVFMETTTVRDTPEQMQLLEATGHSHSEAYRLGSRILTKTKTPAGLKIEEIQERLEAEELVIQAAFERKQALLNEIRELDLKKEAERAAREDLENVIEVMCNRLHTIKRDVRNNAPYKKTMIQEALTLVPEGTITYIELDNFLNMKEGIPDIYEIRDFVTSKLIF